MRVIIHLLIVLILGTAVVGCSGGLHRDYSLRYRGIANRGLLLLSATNPYMGPNLFLSAQAELDPALKGFLRGNGAPQAIRIIERQNKPALMYLYYPFESVLFIAENVADREAKWVITGPYEIPPLELEMIISRSKQIAYDPPLLISGKVVRYAGAVSKPYASNVIEKPSIPKPLPPPKKLVRKKAKKKRARNISKSKGPKISIVRKKPPFVPLNFDQQAIAISKGFAERARNGDLIHTVQGSETLEEIARWYTGTVDTVRAIKMATKLPSNAVLKPGMRIVIPYQYVINPKQFKKKDKRQ